MMWFKCADCGEMVVVGEATERVCRCARENGGSYDGLPLREFDHPFPQSNVVDEDATGVHDWAYAVLDRLKAGQ